MKIRNDFVTNSSSSSFIIIGKEVKLSEINLHDNTTYYGVGKELCEGEDVFVIDSNILNYLNTNILCDKLLDKSSEINFYKAYFICGNDIGNISLSIEELSKKIPSSEKFGFINIDRDYGSSDCVEDLINRYEEDDY